MKMALALLLIPNKDILNMSPTVATPINYYDIEDVPYGLRLGGTNKGCLTFFGIFFILPGIFIIGTMLQLIPVSKIPEPYSGSWWAMTGLGFAFIFFCSGKSY